MSTTTGTWRDGRVVLDRPVDWPEGCRVLLEAVPDETFGIAESEWSDTPEGIADWLAWYDRLEPLEMTAAELAAWNASRRESAEHGAARLLQRIEHLFP